MMKEATKEKQWVLCPWCGAKTRLQIFRETELTAQGSSNAKNGVKILRKNIE